MFTKILVTSQVVRGTEVSKTSPAAAVLNTLYRSCVRTIWQKALLLEQATRGVLESGKVTSKMTPSQMLRFFLVMTMKYRARPPVYMWLDPSDIFFVEQKPAAIGRYAHECPECISEILTTFDRVTNSGITVSQLVNFETQIPEPSESRMTITNEPARALQEIFKGISLSSIDSVFREVDIRLEDLSTVDVPGGNALAELIAMLSQSEFERISVAYIVIETALSVYETVALESTFPDVRIFDKCSKLLAAFVGHWDSIYADSFTSPKKDQYVIRIFNIVLESMKADIRSDSLFQRADHDNLTRALDKILLTLPSDMVVANVPLSEISGADFVRNSFACWEYEFIVTNLKNRNGLVLLTEDVRFRTAYINGRIYISPIDYIDLSFKTEFNSSNILFVDVPVIGSRMASLLWHALLLSDVISKTALDPLYTYYKCMMRWNFGVPNYEGTFKDFRAIVISFTKSLGTLVKTVESKDWHAERMALGYLKMSHSQLFFIKYAHSWCSNDYNRFFVDVINMPLSRIKSFGTAFHCPAGSEMSRVTNCSFSDDDDAFHS